MEDDKTGALILALQNRINDFEAKLQKAEEKQAGMKWADMPSLENKLSSLRAEISEMMKLKADLPKTPVVIPENKTLGEYFDEFFK